MIDGPAYTAGVLDIGIMPNFHPPSVFQHAVQRLVTPSYPVWRNLVLLPSGCVPSDIIFSKELNAIYFPDGGSFASSNSHCACPCPRATI